MVAGAEKTVSTARCPATVELTAGDAARAAAGLLAGAVELTGSETTGVPGSFCDPPLLLIVTPGATSAVDAVEPAEGDVVPEVDVDVDAAPVVSVEVDGLGSELLPCGGLVADSVELVVDDELLVDDADDDEVDDDSSAAATP